MGRRIARDIKRTEVLSVRIDPKLRYLAELAARQQRRNLSSFTEWAIEEALKHVTIALDGKTIADYANFLWEVDEYESDRFVKLAFHFEGLLNHDEQLVWKLIKDNSFFWFFNEDLVKAANILDPCKPKMNVINELVCEDKGAPNCQRIREYWPLLQAVARGQEPLSSLPTLERPSAKAPAPSATTPRAVKRQPRKD